MLSCVLRGTRNFSIRMAEEVARKLGLSGHEAECFSLRVQLESTSSIAQRARVIEKLHALDPSTAAYDLSADRFKMIAEWYHLPLLELTDLTGPELTAASASSQLGISTNEASLALDRLERLELLRRNAAGRYVKVHDNLLASSNLPDSGLRRYHGQMLAKAIESIETQSPKRKVIGSYNVAFDPEQLPRVQELMKELFLKVGQLSHPRKKRALYHFASVFFELTRSTEERNP